MPLSRRGWIFFLFVPLPPIGQKLFGIKLLDIHDFYAEVLLRGIKSQLVTWLILFLKLLSGAVLENKNKICVQLCLLEKWF
jgi:hypothetical protein